MRIVLIAATATTALLLASCGSTPKPSTPALPDVPTTSTAKQAVAHVTAASGSLVSGSITLTPQADGIRLTGTLGGLPAGSAHGFHVHEKGDCSAVDATSAGGHFNPFGASHGAAGSGVLAHHAGDMNNIVADGEGVAKVNLVMHGVTLGGGAVNDIAGRAFIVHASPDDYTSQPTGNAGARLACGVIKVTQ